MTQVSPATLQIAETYWQTTADKLSALTGNVSLYAQEPATYFQLIMIGCVFAVALGAGWLIERRLNRILSDENRTPSGFHKRLARLSRMIAPVIALVLLVPVLRIAASVWGDNEVSEIAFRLSTVWFFWTMIYSLISSPLVRSIGLWVLVPAAVLHAFDELHGIIAMLDSASVEIGSVTITAYTGAKAVVFFIIVFWIANTLSQIGADYIRARRTLNISTKELLIKLFDIVLYIITFIVALNLIGIDLTALTVFGGALGVGLGFGLQKIASNFISGIILLSERSITIGNLVEMDNGVYGYLRKLGARASVIETFDGKEVLVPNEDFITSRVSNLTHTTNRGRVEVAVGVAYSTDLDKAHALILEAAIGCKRVSKVPEFKPECWLRNFGDSSVDFLLVFWLDDVRDGKWRAQSDVMFGIWRAFKENGIEIPFPQRDLHIRSTVPEALSIPHGAQTSHQESNEGGSKSKAANSEPAPDTQAPASTAHQTDEYALPKGRKRKQQAANSTEVKTAETKAVGSNAFEEKAANSKGTGSKGTEDKNTAGKAKAKNTKTATPKRAGKNAAST